MNQLGTSALWDSLVLPAGLSLGGKQFSFFQVPREAKVNGRRRSISDTNMREAGKVATTFTVSSISWQVLPVRGDAPVEQLASAFGVSSVEEIRANGVLAWALPENGLVPEKNLR